MDVIKLIISRFSKLFSMIEASKIKLLIIGLMVLALSSLELISLALIGVYLGFIVSPTTIMGDLSSFSPMLGELINENLSLSSQYIVFGLILLGVFLLKLFFVLFSNFYIFKFSTTQQLMLQEKLMSRYINQNYESYIQSSSAFSINAVSTFARRLKDTIQALFRLFADGLLLCFIIILMMSVDLKIFSILALIFSTFIIGYYVLFITKVKGYGEKFNFSNTMMIKSLTEISNGFKEIKVLGKAFFFEDLFSKSVRSMADVEIKQNIISLAPRNLLELLVVLFIVLSVTFTIIWGNDLSQAVITLGIFSVCAVRIIPMITQIFTSINTIKYGEDALIKLFNSISTPTENETLRSTSIDNSHDNKFISSFKKMDVKNLSFGYPNSEKPIIKEANLQIESGDFIGIIGPSGAGKTTLVDILLGLLKPQAGNIIVDGVNIFDDIKGWRSKIAYIPQEIFIINDTIRNNIILGDDPQSISNTRLDDAISQSKLTQFINDLPDGLSSNVGDKGVSISGGQKQRVAIARALYHQREILILDEATSALDSSTEEKITGQFEALKGKKTVICIAHRTSTLKSCNKIYSIENGIIIQKNSI